MTVKATDGMMTDGMMTDGYRHGWEGTDSSITTALTEIARIATAALGGPPMTPNPVTDPTPACGIKTLPARLAERAAQVARQINPTNAPSLELLPPGVSPPAYITLATRKYWGSAPRAFSVSFMESTPADLRARIISHLNAWSLWSNKSFAETSGVGEVRISRGPGGYYSYLGTDITLIPQNRQTMNLEGFTMSHSESEFRRVVRHEAGHTLGFVHEHMRRELVARIDRAKAYAYYAATQGWSPAMVDQQVLTPLEESSIYGTSPDQDSIMCYQVPGSITYDGQPIRGGTDINATDYAFAALIYPRSFSAPPAGPGPTTDDWDASMDVPAMTGMAY